MKDKKQFFQKIKEIWEKEFPQWRFGQLISNLFDFFCKESDPFYWEDDDFVGKMQTFADYKAKNKTLCQRFQKHDLCTGDFVVRRSGEVELVIKERNVLMTRGGGWNDLNTLKEDLTDVTDKSYDIIKVYRPTFAYQQSFDHYKEGWIAFIRQQ